jgi:hypothetical protein
MPRTKHGYCTLHRIGYSRQLDPTCPQCTLAGLQATQVDYNPEATQTVEQTVGTPVDESGKPISAEELDTL